MLNCDGSNITVAAETGRLYSLASWLRPRSYWDVVVYHFPLALISGLALLLPYLVSLDRLPQIPCTFLHLTGYPCPLCGVTRAFWAIANGQWAYALTHCPIAFGVYAITVGLFMWNAAALVLNLVISPGPLLRWKTLYRRKALMLSLLLLAANWIYRLSMGFDRY